MAEMGYVDWGGGPVDEHHGMGHGTPVEDLVADPDRPADVTRDPDRPVEDGQATPSTAPPRADARGDRRRPGRGDPGQRQRRRRHHAALARRRRARTPRTASPASPRTRCCRARSTSTASSPTGRGHLLVPLAPGLPRAGAPRSARCAGDPSRGAPTRRTQEALAVLHRYADGATLNGKEGTTTVDAEPGQAVRLRVVNTDNGLASLWVTGAPYRVLAVDGSDVNEPGEIVDREVRPAGRRPRRPGVRGARRTGSGSTSAARTALVLGARTPPRATSRGRRRRPSTC